MGEPGAWVYRWDRCRRALGRWRWTITAVGGVVTLGFALWASRFDGPLPTHKVGTIGEWLAAIGTIAAVVFALTTRQIDEYRREADRRNSQVRSVILIDPNLIPVASAVGQRYRLEARIGNFSDRPIRAVRILLQWSGEGSPSHFPDSGPSYEVPLGPNDTTSDWVAPVIAPSEIRTYTEVEKYAHSGLTFTVLIAKAMVQFIDIHGDEWQAWFGPLGHHARVRRLSNSSGFWRDYDTNWY